jgi:hypothetical protein
MGKGTIGHCSPVSPVSDLEGHSMIDTQPPTPTGTWDGGSPAAPGGSRSGMASPSGTAYDPGTTR